ncbi:MAG: Clostripain family protein, partial [Muribaculaceae bacterium]|nr:Clostripain family protein [Muribaculaceae bacterium]
YEIEYQNGTCRHIPISTYNNYPFTTEQGLTSLFIDLKTYAPAKNYSMIIGCHGMGWLPVSTSRAIRSDDKQHWDYPNVPLTRYFGGTTQEFQTDISTLASALSNADLKMQYILFDDCYMSSIEVAYELKDVTNYLIASTCEVMAYGMPYAKMGQYLLGAPDYKAVCDEFYKFYSTYSAAPYGTLSVTDCSKLDALAELMRQINLNYRFDATQITLLQRLDGYSPTIFFDYGDYVNKLLTYNNADQEFIDTFNQKLSSVVPLKTNTEKFFTASRGPLPIYTYSGITTSDPSISPKTIEKTETKWYNATH